MSNLSSTVRDDIGAGLIERPATVVFADGHWAWVESQAQSACGSCQKSDCGFGVLGKAFGGKVMRIKIPNTFGAKAYDRIIIGFSHTKLLDASMMAYLIPAATTVAGAIVMAPFGDGVAALGAIVGMGLGFGFLKLRFGEDERNWTSGARYLRPDQGDVQNCNQ